MPTLVYSAVDLFVVGVATVVALLVRDDFFVTLPRLAAVTPYSLMSIGFAALVLPGLGISKRIWQFTNLADCRRIGLASVIVVVAALSLAYRLGTLAGVGRSLPVLQTIFMTGMLVGIRIAARTFDARRRHLIKPEAGAPTTPTAPEFLLVVGLGRLTEVYMRAMLDAAPRNVRVVGVLTGSEQHVGRLMLGYPVLGTLAQIDSVLDDLMLHGIKLDRIVVTSGAEALSGNLRASFARAETDLRIRVEGLDAQHPLSWQSVPIGALPPRDAGDAERLTFKMTAADLAAPERRAYWSLKRCIDVIGALLLLLLLSPVIAAVGLLVAIEFGLPVMFWQMRPGRGERSFRLYKFRSMLSARDDAGRRRTEPERMTATGRFLRRTRLDELPQLMNILIGDMSFVGPRPLLQAEQSASYAARLLVRPGLTGWAQVKGGRAICVADKAALDVWYARNASLLRDAEIILRTIPMLILGERVNTGAIVAAWRDLELAGICRPRGHVAGETIPATDRLAA